MSGFMNAIKRAAAAGANSTSNRQTGADQEDREMRFSIQPAPGESGFSQWVTAMKMVSQLPGGIPPEFRRRLWLNLAERHLAVKGVDWPRVERNCFSEWSHPADAELGVQIVKDLHRTGCSLFCGEDGQENQALLKRVLLAYARWNKAVGYCQGFNMLAALILQVTDKCEADALKLMIYLIEGVLPESYFADSLRGLSVDMAVFRELLRSKLPYLSRHLDALQAAAKDGTTSYEPPLTNVFTMQWFLTLFCNCLPQPTVLRVWDLILLEGNEMLLRTALAIWQVLAERIMAVKSADEFYCIMGVLTREILEFGLIDANSLIKAVVAIGALTELKSLREHYLYNINPWGAASISTLSERQLKLYPKERLVLDISALKKQYAKLKQRQRQAHIIFNAAVARQPPRASPVAMNHLLLGKSALVPAKRLGPPKGAIPPARQQRPATLHWKDAAPRPAASSSSSSSSDTELCDEPGRSPGNNTSDEEGGGRGGEASQFETDNPVVTDKQLGDISPSILMNVDNTQSEDTSAIAGVDFIEESPLATFDRHRQEATAAFDDGRPLGFINSNGSVSSSDNSSTKMETKKDNKSLIDDLLVVNTSNGNDAEEMGKEKAVAEGLLPGLILEAESDEDGFDFERFLEERVRCVKLTDEDDVQDEEEEVDLSRVEFGRKNSQRALQIMQENSLILHRILQCQSRMSPSPPPLPGEEKEASPCCSTSVPSVMDANLESETFTSDEMRTSTSLLDMIRLSPEPEFGKFESSETRKGGYFLDFDASPQNETMATDVNVAEFDFDMSPRDEKTVKLDATTEGMTAKLDFDMFLQDEISTKLEADVPPQEDKTAKFDFDAFPDEERATTELHSNMSPQDEKTANSEKPGEEVQPGTKYSSILEYSKNLNEKYNTLILNSNLAAIAGGKSGEASEIAKMEGESTSSPVKEEAFNPFPVKITPKPKDVPLRLGLYKK